MAWKLTIAGVDRTAIVDAIAMSAVLNERTSAQITLADFIPDKFDEVISYAKDGTTPMFGGVVLSRSFTGRNQYDPTFQVSLNCGDYFTYADWCHTSAKYDLDITLKAVLQDLVTDHLGVYGITLDPAQAEGPLLAPFSWTTKRVSDALRELSDRTGYVARISATKQLRLVVPGTTAAPVAVTEAAPHCHELSWTDTDRTPANKVIVVAGPAGPQQVADERHYGDGTTRIWELYAPFLQIIGALSRSDMEGGWPVGIYGVDIDPSTGTEFPYSYDPALNAIRQRADQPVVPAGQYIWLWYMGAFPFQVEADCLPPSGPQPLQLFPALLQAPSGGGSWYLGPTFGRYVWHADAYAAPWLVAGDFKNAAVTINVAPGAGQSVSYTLVKNGADTPLTITVSGTATTGSSAAAVTVAPGDLLMWRRTVPGFLSAAPWESVSVEFVAATPEESGYASTNLVNGNNFTGPVFSSHQWTSGALGTGTFEPVAVAGAVTALSFRLSAAPGAGNSWTCVLVVNGVAQNGSGGTPDTRVTIAGSATTGSWAGTVAVAAGAWIAFQQTAVGTPTGFTSYGVKFVAAAPAVSTVGALVGENLPNFDGTAYATPTHQRNGAGGRAGWTPAAADAEVTVGSACFLRALRVRIGSVATGPVTFTLMKNGAATALTAAIASTDTAADLVNEVAVAAGDRLAMRCTGAGFFFTTGAWALELRGTVAGVSVPPIEQVISRPDVLSKPVAQEIADGLITAFCAQPRELLIVTDEDGWIPGQALSVDLPITRSIAGAFVVTDVGMTIVQDTAAGDAYWQYTLKAIESEAYQGSYLDEWRQLTGGGSGSSSSTGGATPPAPVEPGGGVTGAMSPIFLGGSRQFSQAPSPAAWLPVVDYVIYVAAAAFTGRVRADVWAQHGAVGAQVRLYNLTDGVETAISEVVTATTPTAVTFTAAIVAGKTYRLEQKATVNGEGIFAIGTLEVA